MMNMQQIENEIRSLAKSQGFYGRLLEQVLTMKEEDPQEYGRLKEEWEGLNFSDALEFIRYIEEGKRPANAPKLTSWLVPVTVTTKGMVRIDAASAEEACSKAKELSPVDMGMIEGPSTSVELSSWDTNEAICDIMRANGLTPKAILINQETGKEVKVGDVLKTRDGEEWVLDGIRERKVDVHKGDWTMQYYLSVFGLAWKIVAA